MKKADLTDELARVANLTRPESEAIVNAVFDAIADALAKGDKVELRDFGSFKTRLRRARTARNPKSGASVNIPGKRVPLFKVGKRLRAAMNP